MNYTGTNRYEHLHSVSTCLVYVFVTTPPPPPAHGDPEFVGIIELSGFNISAMLRLEASLPFVSGNGDRVAQFHHGPEAARFVFNCFTFRFVHEFIFYL